MGRVDGCIENDGVCVGFKRVGDLVPGDRVLGADGSGVMVTEKFDVHVPERMFEMVFGNETFRVSGNHLWYTVTPIDLAESRIRVKEFRKLLPFITPELLLVLESMSVLRKNYEVKSPSLIDLRTMLGFFAPNSERFLFSLVRVTDSLGVAKRLRTGVEAFEGLGEGEFVDTNFFDTERFAQQVLALYDLASRKKVHGFELLPGKVRETKEIFLNPSIHDFPTVLVKK